MADQPVTANEYASTASGWLLSLGALNGFLAVAFGAFGAHGLTHLADERMLSVYEKAADYHAWHALAIFMTGLAVARCQSRWTLAAGALFLLGVLLFSGSLYAIALGGPGWLGPVTPVGGSALLAGWLALSIGCWRSRHK
jgi:uncharacterized membrane protein YgdD (TMEM256/DUF423 family)